MDAENDEIKVDNPEKLAEETAATALPQEAELFVEEPPSGVSAEEITTTAENPLLLETPMPQDEVGVTEVSIEEAQRAPSTEAQIEGEAPVEAAETESVREREKKRRSQAKQEATQLKELEPHRANLPWYVVHTLSGFEMVAKKNLEERIRMRGLSDKFGNILVPQETVVELVRGVKKTSTKKFFPGYLLVQVALDEDTWHLVNETAKISGFVGDSRNPSALQPAEVENLVKQIEGGPQRARPRVTFEEGDAVKVVDGPFTDFNGTVDEVKADKGKLRVLISIFGRNTPVELDFVQVEKA